MAIGSPQPAVLHLVTLFRRITAGDIRIPAFQRDFVWKEKQMIELLQSVVEGFPIGSILLWGVDRKMLQIASSAITSFPDVNERYPTSYVLDGMQRLSTLYGVFHFGSSTDDSRFDVLFDLATDRFFHRSAEVESDTSVPLAALFSPRRLLEHQARLSKIPSSDKLIDRLLLLQASFQEYMVPVVTISSPDIHRIVGIFERINSTGTKLDPVDFMRAITWAEDFDLNHYLEVTQADLFELGMRFSDETIIKCVGLILDIPPTTDDLLQLRSRTPAELADAFERVIDCMREVSKFVRERFCIYSSDLIPYEGQTLLLFRAIGMDHASEEEEDLVAQWFWAAGFNESLRGKPDHYVVRAVANWRALVQGEIRGLEPRLKISPLELFDRRLVSGGALSATFAAMFAVNEACDLNTGHIVDPPSFMSSADLGSFDSVVPRPALEASGATGAISARILGNVVLTNRSGYRSGYQSIRSAILRQDWRSLKSQFVDEKVVSALEAGDYRTFVESRVQLMHTKALSLVNGTHLELMWV